MTSLTPVPLQFFTQHCKVPANMARLGEVYFATPILFGTSSENPQGSFPLNVPALSYRLLSKPLTTYRNIVRSVRNCLLVSC